jgi:glycosyltransferase involved in cell wall biosynthesis
LFIENLRPSEAVWWLKYVPESTSTELVVVRVDDTSFRRSFLSLVRVYFGLGRFDAVITHQDSMSTFVLGSLNALWNRPSCRHIVNEFITTERRSGLYSALKYRFLRFALSRVSVLICSSRGELEYYQRALGLRTAGFQFIPFATNPEFADTAIVSSDRFLLSAGRTGRDYATLLRAVDGLPVRVVIVAGRSSMEGLHVPQNVEVLFDIPQPRLHELVRRAAAVVVPLNDQPISIGQSVIVHAMAAGTPVIATRLNATVDYITDGVNGILVPPKDVDRMRVAIMDLWADDARARKLGRAGAELARDHFLVDKKIAAFCRLLGAGNSARSKVG